MFFAKVMEPPPLPKEKEKKKKLLIKSFSIFRFFIFYFYFLDGLFLKKQKINVVLASLEFLFYFIFF
jgi:hypothetical protein